MGLFRNLFDFNGNGELDAFEVAVEFGVSMNMTDSDQEDQLTSEGFEVEELERMDDDERREAIEDAGLDPDDYDF